jgi:mRNA-degrading endonuclease toxin of MazEF toxin-antitoxin module
MTLKRGDVVLARVPHLAGTRGKKRPAVVIQGDAYNTTLRHVIVAEVTSNPRWLADPACLTIDISTPEGQATGLHKNGVVSCLHLVTMSMDRLDPAIGALSPQLLQKLDGCMKVALGLT